MNADPKLVCHRIQYNIIMSRRTYTLQRNIKCCRRVFFSYITRKLTGIVNRTIIIVIMLNKITMGDEKKIIKPRLTREIRSRKYCKNITCILY